MNGSGSWLLYGAAGYTGALIAQHAQEHGHRPLLVGRSAPAVTALADKLDLPYRVLALDDPAGTERRTGRRRPRAQRRRPLPAHRRPPRRRLPVGGRALPRHRQRVTSVLRPVRPARARRTSRSRHHPRRWVRGSRHQLSRPLRQRRRRRRSTRSKSPPELPPPKRAPVSWRPDERTCPTEAGSAKKANCTRSRSAPGPQRWISRRASPR